MRDRSQVLVVASGAATGPPEIGLQANVAVESSASYTGT